MESILYNEIRRRTAKSLLLSIETTRSIEGNRVRRYTHPTFTYVLLNCNFCPQTLAKPIDLWKRHGSEADFVKIATNVILIMDNEFDNWNILHVVSLGEHKGPVLVLTKEKITINEAEGDKVYMSLRNFPLETYFFTCPSANLAESLSNSCRASWTERHGRST